MKIVRLFVLVAGLLAWGGAAHAQGQSTPQEGISASVAEGRARFQRGVTLFREGDFRAALIEFNRAYEAAPNYRILYNIGQTRMELQDYPCALKSLERYVSEAGGGLPPERRTEVEADIARVRSRIGHVRITVNRAGAEIFVDDVLVGRSPLDAEVTVGAGRRRISVSKPPSPAVHRVLDVAGGDHANVTVELADERAEPPPQPPSEQPRSSTTGVWIGVVTSGTLAAATGVFAVLALNAKSKLDTEQDKYPADATAIDDARSRLKTMALTTDILGATTIVAIGVTTVLALTRKSGSSSSAGTGTNITLAPGGVAGRF